MRILYVFIAVTSIIFSSFDAHAVDINDSNIKYALENNDISAIDNFINQGLDVNSRDINGNTILYNALIKNRLKIAKKLIDAGADINAPSAENGMTPLIIATSTANRLIKQAESMISSDEYAQSRVAEIKLKEYMMHQMKIARKILQMLIDSGADINQETPFGTPLMNASTNPLNIELIDILIKSGAKVNARDRNGRTALFYAEIYGDNKISSKLLAAGADIDIKDLNGKNYMEVSKKDFDEN